MIVTVQQLVDAMLNPAGEWVQSPRLGDYEETLEKIHEEMRRRGLRCNLEKRLSRHGLMVKAIDLVS